MSQLERVDLLTTPPVVGRFYLVRIVHAKYFGQIGDWPVIGPEHDDAEFFGFYQRHYHIDFRFVRWSDERAAERHSYVLYDHPSQLMGKPVLRRRKCVRSSMIFSIPWNAKRDPLDVMREHYAGRQCNKGKGGWICPHRNAPLGSLEPQNGIVTCPLHGLRIHVDTGRVMPTDAQITMGRRV